METIDLVRDWFNCWENEEPEQIPISPDFKHTSPYGTINGKKAYLDLVEANRDKFLGNKFEFRDQIIEGNRACVRYGLTNKNLGFAMEVCEWIYVADGLIREIVSYYDIKGEIEEKRKLKNPK